MDQGDKRERKKNPQEDANLISYLTFFYSLDIFKTAKNKDLEEDDIYNAVESYKSKRLADELEKELDNLRQQDSKNVTLYKLLRRCYGKQYLLLGILQLFVRIVTILLTPIALGKLVKYFSPGQTEVSSTDAYYYAAIILGMNLVNCIYSHNYTFQLVQLGMKIRIALCSLIYRKCLKLNPIASSKFSTGKIVTFVTKDLLAVDYAILFANDLWIGIIQTGIVTYLLYRKVGIATFAGIGFLLFTIPLQILLGKATSATRIRTAKKTDERFQITQEVLTAIKLIKMYTWEILFDGKIAGLRTQEMGKLRLVFYLKAIAISIGALASQVAFYLLIMSYIWMGSDITAEVVYFTITCFHTLRSTITITIPVGIVQTAEFHAAEKRLRTLMNAEELQPQSPTWNVPIAPRIEMKDVTVLIDDKPVLRSINLVLEKGLVVISGTIGNGKSSLLKVILRDYPVSSGKLLTRGRLSFASEEPWLFPASIKHNILFGEPYIDTRYQKVLNICALRLDLSTFPNGDETIVGDNGVNLSKGQQARVNLARAIYKESDIYLLDDCLSSLDPKVQDQVFVDCIKGFLGDKLCLMISNNNRFIKHADTLILLHNGIIQASLKPAEALENKVSRYIDDEDEKRKTMVDDIDNLIANEEVEENITEKSSLIQDQRNIYREFKKAGTVDNETYHQYIKYSGGYIFGLMIVIVYIITQLAVSYNDKLVSNWVNIEEKLAEFKTNQTTNTKDYTDTLVTRISILKYFSITLVAGTVLSLIRFFIHVIFFTNGSIAIHKKMMTRVLNATMEFFDTHLIGNILNRFSKDLTTMDEHIPFITYECGRILLVLGGIMILILTVNPYFIIPSTILFIVMFFVRKYYLPAGRSLKRLDSATRSPLIGHLNATLEGLTTIRAYGRQKIVRNEFDKHQDLYMSAYHMSQIAMRAFGILLDFLCFLFTTTVVLVVLHLTGESGTSAGNVGLAITQAFMLTGLLQWGIRQSAELENQMTAVERAIEYTEVDIESKSGGVIKNWPNLGTISYVNVCLIYKKTNQTVLKNINFDIGPKEKIGIVGRTGAGKSSIIASLYRLYGIQGEIYIDGVDINKISLEFLRSKMSIIPQDPVLFTGSIKDNIDPANRYKDDEIWKAIQTVGLKNDILDIHSKISEGGANFSAGQRQLVCLARAIVQKNMILVLDEATANIDEETANLIHETIQKQFAACTVITIAHRLSSVMKADKIMVIDRGELIEFDMPSVLLKDKNSRFYRMVERSSLL